MKRFYENVDIIEKNNRYYILLDNKIIKTPHKNDLETDILSLAEAMKKEWSDAAQDIIADHMPVTKYMNTLIDRVVPQRDAMNALLVEYINHDSLCYFAGSLDQEFHAIQLHKWLPVIKIFNEAFSLDVMTTEGIMPLMQHDDVIKFAETYVNNLDDMFFMVFYQLVTLSGSFIIAVLILSDRLDPNVAFELSTLEEDHNSQKWGEDSETQKNKSKKKQEWDNVLSFLHYLDH